MKLEDQICSLELAKRLKELGLKQKSLAFWSETPHIMQQQEGGFIKCIETKIETRGTYWWPENEIDSWAAFTVPELGEILPKSIFENCKTYYLKIEPANRLGYWLISYNNTIWTEDLTEVNARAKMLILLIENNLYKPEGT